MIYYNVLDEGFFQLVYQNAELGSQAYGGYLQMVEEQKSYMLEAFLEGESNDPEEVREFITYYQSQLALVTDRLEKLRAQGVDDDKLSQQSERLLSATLKQCFELYPGYQELMQSDELGKATAAIEKAVAQKVLEDTMAALTPELKTQVEMYLQSKDKELEALAAELMTDLQQIQVQNQPTNKQPIIEQPAQPQTMQQQPELQELPAAMPVAQPAPAPTTMPVLPTPTAPIPAESIPVPMPMPTAAVPVAPVPVASVPIAPAQTAQVSAPASNQLPPLPVEVPATQQHAIAAAAREMYRPVNVYPAV